MKTKATMKEIKSTAKRVVGVPYSALHYLLNHKTPTLYFANELGWRCDFYPLNKDVGIVTGYAYDRACDVHAPLSVCRTFDDKAMKLLEKGGDSDVLIAELDKLLTEFVDVIQ